MTLRDEINDLDADFTTFAHALDAAYLAIGQPSLFVNPDGPRNDDMDRAFGPLALAHAEAQRMVERIGKLSDRAWTGPPEGCPRAWHVGHLEKVRP